MKYGDANPKFDVSKSMEVLRASCHYLKITDFHGEVKNVSSFLSSTIGFAVASNPSQPKIDGFGRIVYKPRVRKARDTAEGDLLPEPEDEPEEDEKAELTENTKFTQVLIQINELSPITQSRNGRK